MLDRLTPAVVDIRRHLAEAEALPGVRDASMRQLHRMQALGAGSASRLTLVEDPRYTRHPLLEEAVRLRDRLLERAAEATAETEQPPVPAPAMVAQPVQQQQAQAGQSMPAAEAPPASQPETEAAEIEPSASYKLGPIDRRCRHWEIVLREGFPLPMPEDVHGARDLKCSYAPDRGEEELFGMDAVIQGEENHHRRARGWSYWLHVRDPKTGDVETIQASSARKTVIKDAIRLGLIDLPREILKGSGDIAALVRILSAIRAGLPIAEIVDAE